MEPDRYVDRMLQRLQEAAQDQQRAIEALYQRYAKRFFHYARNRQLTYQEAEEAVQETFIRIFKKSLQYDAERGSPDQWLWGIHRNTVTDILRRRQREAATLEGFEESGVENARPAEMPENDPDAVRDRERRERCLDEAWRNLSPQDQEELKRGRGRGPGRTRWHEAMERFKDGFRQCYEQD